MNQETKVWGWVETYGGKLVENIIQAIARDVLADSMLRLDRLGYDIVMHVHDEIVMEVRDKHAEQALKDVSDELGQEVAWARGLPLKAEGFICNFYQKD
jgi:DNA polymerase bacteriophage-type